MGRHITASAVKAKPPFSWPYVSKACPEDMKRGAWEPGRFHQVLSLGTGAKSKVVLALDRVTSVQVALKIISRKSLSPAEVSQLEREICIHGKLCHPNILAMWAAFCDDQKFYIITELADSDLYKRLPRMPVSEVALVRRVVHPLLCALEHCHANGVIHRDLKPENILFNQKNQLKLADFGLAIDVTHDRPITRLGTLDFMAPEVLMSGRKTIEGVRNEVQAVAGNEIPREQRAAYSSAVDSWSVGVIVYELFARVTPFYRPTRGQTIQAVYGASFSFPTKAHKDGTDVFGANLRSFCHATLSRDPARRADVNTLLEHPLITAVCGPPPAGPPQHVAYGAQPPADADVDAAREAPFVKVAHRGSVDTGQDRVASGAMSAAPNVALRMRQSLDVRGLEAAASAPRGHASSFLQSPVGKGAPTRPPGAPEAQPRDSSMSVLYGLSRRRMSVTSENEENDSPESRQADSSLLVADQGQVPPAAGRASMGAATMRAAPTPTAPRPVPPQLGAPVDHQARARSILAAGNSSSALGVTTAPGLYDGSAHSRGRSSDPHDQGANTPSGKPKASGSDSSGDDKKRSIECSRVSDNGGALLDERTTIKTDDATQLAKLRDANTSRLLHMKLQAVAEEKGSDGPSAAVAEPPPPAKAQDRAPPRRSGLLSLFGLSRRS
ncbi:unnamed protein product [Pedinophyceae sp. YPF-701]|nr:unnamed protein product [Pedinophyceae sp. YPF-701]